MTIRARSVEEGPERRGAACPFRETAQRPSDRVRQPRHHHHGDLPIDQRDRDRLRPAENHLCPTITRQAYDDVAAAQDRYEDADVVVLDGYIGDHPDGAMATRLIVEKSHANLAGMQQHLYFPAGDGFEPELTVIYTPTCPPPATRTSGWSRSTSKPG